MLPQVRFFLKAEDTKGYSYISIRIFSKHFKGLKFKEFFYGTGLKIKTELWDKNSMSVTTKKVLIKKHAPMRYEKMQLQFIEQRLIDIRNECTEILIDFEGKKDYDSVELRKRLDAKFRPKEEEEEVVSFAKYLEEFIKKMTSGLKLNRGKKYTRRTIQSYEALFNIWTGKDWGRKNVKLEGFKGLENDYGKEITFNDITHDFYDWFIGWFYDRGYMLNTVGKYLARLKKIMRESLKDKVHSNLDFQSFYTLKSDAFKVYLNDNEIERIYNLDLKGLQRTHRDIFLVGCYTGLRVSDFKRLTKKHFVKTGKGKDVIKINMVKGKRDIIINYKSRLLEIMERYNYDLPKITEQKLNDDIKDICELADIDDTLTYVVNRGGKDVEITCKKYEKISSHTARRSAATNMYLAGIGVYDIKELLGHRKIETTQSYICVTVEEIANRLSDHDYFE